MYIELSIAQATTVEKRKLVVEAKQGLWMQKESEEKKRFSWREA